MYVCCVYDVVQREITKSSVGYFISDISLCRKSHRRQGNGRKSCFEVRFHLNSYFYIEVKVLPFERSNILATLYTLLVT